VTRTSDPRAAAAPPPGPISSSSSDHGRFEPGTRLGTRYRIVALLGRGGMGEVYRADDLELGQSVALKFLPTGVAANPTELSRFRGEVRVARQIAHPNVCRVYDIGEADGHVFLSMEYIDGEDLSAVLRRMGRPTTDKAVEIARQICLGLAAAHEAGMLHRDLKPANIMVDGRGRARITDFGLAGLAVELARAGQVAGTPAYMAPEQLADGSVSVRSDVYSLGLVLYELFTGRRAFSATNMTELRRLQDSSSITSPSDLARDIDPAVERLILHCLERDPDARPASAYAVLGALPGGDPLAAALAAGETPSPELVANAGDRGGLAPTVLLLCVGVTLAALAVWAGVLGPELRPLTKPTPELAVRASDLLARTGSFAVLPKHTAEGFAMSRAYLNYSRTHADSALPAGGQFFFWRRWSHMEIEPTNLHSEIVSITDPPGVGMDEAAVLLSPDGRLIGLRATPPDSMKAAHGGHPVWNEWLAMAGLDTTALAPAALAKPVPAMCDTAAAWTGALPGGTGTVQMGASRGRLVHFVLAYAWGATSAPLELRPPEDTTAQDLFDLVFLAMIPLLASIYFGLRNQRLGRGDWRSATNIAAFVFLANMFESFFTTRLSEVGLLNAGYGWVAGRAFGHSLIHGVGMWFAYMALEPYLRRLWPRILVSWTRLVSGRVRDPLVGRDLVIGVMAGALITALSVLGSALAPRLHLAQVPTQIGPRMLVAVTSLTDTGCNLAYAFSVCVLNSLESLVLILLLRLLLRNTVAAVALSMLILGGSLAVGSAQDVGWFMAIYDALLSVTTVVVTMRLGLLPGVLSLFTGLVLAYSVASFDFSAWYADRALLPLGLLVAIVIYGAVTALAGKSILGDPLEGARGR
jgi:serine/threonine-protein kinase